MPTKFGKICHVKTVVPDDSAHWLTPVDFDYIKDWLSAYGTGRVGTLMQANSTVVTHTHVSTLVQHTVRSLLQTHCTFVGRVVFRFSLRPHNIRRGSGWGWGSGYPGAGRGDGSSGRLSTGDCGHRLRRRRREGSNTTSSSKWLQSWQHVWINRGIVSCRGLIPQWHGVVGERSGLFRRQGRRQLRWGGAYHWWGSWRGWVPSAARVLRVLRATPPLRRSVHHTWYINVQSIHNTMIIS